LSACAFPEAGEAAAAVVTVAGSVVEMTVVVTSFRVIVLVRTDGCGAAA
jgi:hypothetical protein